MENQIDNDFRDINEEIKVNEKDQQKTLISSKTNENILNITNEYTPNRNKISPETLLEADILDFFHKGFEQQERQINSSNSSLFNSCGDLLN